MKFSDFAAALAERMSGPLKALGFKRVSDGLFVRFNETHEINVISVQKHSSEPRVCLNFGVHYDFMPKIGSTELPSEGDVELSDCEVKVRITTDPSQKDHWWPISSDSVDEIVALTESRIEGFFNRYNINGDISSIVVDDLNDSLPDVFASLTKVRLCIVLARIQETLGNTEAAVAFAKYGIQAAGMAVGPKKMLKEVLKRLEQN